MNPKAYSTKAKSLFLVAIIVLLVVPIAVAAGLAFSSNKQQQAEETRILEKPTRLETKPTSESAAEVKITDQGFEPAMLSVSPGAVVTWTNNSDSMHQVASNPHSAHNGLPGLMSPILNSDQTYEFTFNERGSFGYHDELNPTLNATIEVQ